MVRLSLLYTLVIALLLVGSFTVRAADKKMTIYQRQVNLMKRVNAAQKDKQLTVRQAKGLRKDLSKIATSKQKVRDKHAGKSGTADMSNVEKRLNDTSDKINQRIQDNLDDR